LLRENKLQGTTQLNADISMQKLKINFAISSATDEA